MNSTAYKQSLKILDRAYQTKKNNLIKQCALENNPYKIGDIIEGQGYRIAIQKISVTVDYSSRLPTCFFEGKRLTKANKEYKSAEYGRIYQQSAKLVEEGKND